VKNVSALEPAMPIARPTSLLDAVIFIAVFLAGEIIVEFYLLISVAGITRRNLLSAVVKTVSFLILTLVIRRRLHEKVFANMPVYSAPAISYLLVAIGVVGTDLLAGPLSAFLRRTFEFYYYYSNRLGTLYRPKDIVGTVLLTLLVAPVVEEMIFRGVILRGFLQRFKTPLALLLSSLLFAVFHHNPAQFIGPLLVGIMLGAAYVRTRSIIPCVFGHVLTNAMWFVGKASPAASKLMSTGIHNGEPGILIFRVSLGVVLSSLCLVFLLAPKRQSIDPHVGAI
jgi:membrane protease YdiL (CAAX protease family)